MLMTALPVESPLQHVSSGKLQTARAWTHPSRTIDSYVLIIGLLGEACLRQDDTDFTIRAGDVALLSAHHNHSGTCPSLEPVSYYWTHFYCRTKPVEWEAPGESILPVAFLNRSEETIVLPTVQRVKNLDRICMLFRQMLHTANKKTRSAKAVDYLLTVLLLEIFDQYQATQTNSLDKLDSAKQVAEIAEWIRVNLTADLSVGSIAERFRYNPDYLSRIFKKCTGYSMVRFIAAARINRAKTLLLNTHGNVQEIAYAVGFNDEKYFMRVFKQTEGISPSQFRNAFFYIHMNAE